MLIIMADLMAISVGNVFMAAVVPGLTLAAFYLIYVASLAAIRPSLAPPLPRHLLNIPRSEMAPLVARSFLPPVFLIGLIKGSILFGWATPSEAGAVGAFGATILAAANRRLNWAMLVNVCRTSARTVSMIFFIVISATCFAYVYRSLGGDDVVEHLIVEKAGLEAWGMLILVMVIVFFLGFFLDFLEITLIVLPVFTPLVIAMDFGDHVPAADIKFWFIILLAVNLQTSFLTPPFGFALFYMKGIAPKEIRIQSIYRGIIPFVFLQALGVVTVMLFPDVALWLMHAAYD